MMCKDFDNDSTDLTNEFLQILEKTPSRLKRIRNWKVSLCFGHVEFIANT